jgi:START domain
MIPYKTYLICCALLALSTIVNAQFNLAWELKLNKNNIEVYSAKAPNANVKAVKAHTYFNTTTDKLLAYLLSPEMHVKNLTNCIYSKLLKNEGDTGYYFHQQYDLPWPVTDREVVYLFKVQRLPNKHVFITSEAIPNYLPANPNYIRLTEFTAQWKINTTSATRVDAHYMVLANPAGSIPTWFLNMFLVNGPYDSFKKMNDYFNAHK